jgi:uncharacterized DUF497 family protein
LDAEIQQHGSEPRVLCFARTKARRLWTALYTERGGNVRVVTAYEMKKSQQRLYFQER